MFQILSSSRSASESPTFPVGAQIQALLALLDASFYLKLESCLTASCCFSACCMFCDALC